MNGMINLLIRYDKMYEKNQCHSLTKDRPIFGSYFIYRGMTFLNESIYLVSPSNKILKNSMVIVQFSQPNKSHTKSSQIGKKCGKGGIKALEFQWLEL